MRDEYTRDLQWQSLAYNATWAVVLTGLVIGLMTGKVTIVPAPTWLVWAVGIAAGLTALLCIRQAVETAVIMRRDGIMSRHIDKAFKDSHKQFTYLDSHRPNKDEQIDDYASRIMAHAPHHIEEDAAKLYWSLYAYKEAQTKHEEEPAR